MQEKITLTEAFAAGVFLTFAILAPFTVFSLEKPEPIAPAAEVVLASSLPHQCGAPPRASCTDAELNGLSVPVGYTWSVTQSGYGIDEPRTRFGGGR